jgi:delta(3,5)-delta(2,4)-dienoyl-CoA isomerase
MLTPSTLLSDFCSVEEGLKYVTALNSALLQSDDMPMAMLAVMQKQTPKFSKL